MFGQHNAYIHYTTNDGLPSSIVYHLLQDKRGYMWFSTDKGVVKFDGYSFKTFTVSDGLPINDIWEIKEDALGRIWCLSHSDKLAYIDKANKVYVLSFPNKFNVKEIVLSPNSILEDKNNGEVFIFKKPYMYTLKSNKIIENKTKKDYTFWAKKEGNYAWFIKRNANKMLGFCKKNISNNLDSVLLQKTWFEANDIDYKTLRYSKNSAYFNNKNTIYRYDFKRDTILEKDVSQYATNNNLIIKYLENHLWQINDSIFCFSDDFKKIKFRYHIEGNIKVSKALIDSEENLWLNTYNNGIYCLPQKQKNAIILKNNNVSINVTAFALVDDNIIMGDANGRLYLKGKEKTKLIYSSKYDIQTNKITVWNDYIFIAFNSADRIIVLNKKDLPKLRNGVLKIPEQPYGTSRTVQFPKQERKIDISAKNMYKENNQLLISSGRSSYSLTQKGSHFQLRFFKTASLSYATVVIDDVLYQGSVRGLRHGNIVKCKEYVEDSLVRARPVASSNSLFSRSVFDLAKTNKKRLWVATDGFGVYSCIDCLSGKAQRIEGTKGDIVRRLFVENDTVVWAATNHGVKRIVIERLHPLKYNVDRFTIHHGLASNLVNEVFVRGNKLYVGTEKGVTILNYKEITKKNSPKIKLYIHSFEVDSTWYSNLDKRIVLDRNQNNLRIGYAGISFNRNHAIRYITTLKFRGKTFSKTTTDTTSNIMKEFTYLQPGHYTFIVKAMLNGEISTTEPITFYIRPYWYERLSVEIGFFVLFSVLIWMYFRGKVKIRKKQLQKEKAANKKRAELELSALRSQMNPHFFSNSMTAIQQFILSEQVMKASDYLSQFTHLMRRFLEASREKFITLEHEIDLLKRYIELEQLRFPNKFEVQFRIDKELDTKIEIPSVLLQTYIENAINHGLLPKKQGKGQLKISFSKKNHFLECIIEDNGIGRLKSKELSKNKKGVYQSKGMQLLEDRVNLLKETNWETNLIVEDAYPEKKECGTRVIFSVKINE